MSAVAAKAKRVSASESVTALDAGELAAVLADITRTSRRELRLPMGASTIAALRTIVESGPIRMGDLATHEGVTPATLSRIVSALEEGKYAVRQVDTADRRSAFISATASGRNLLERVRSARGAIIEQRVARMSADDQQALVAALPALRELARP
jgi:DNA-binding MarR family transcriptional regulator